MRTQRRMRMLGLLAAGALLAGCGGGSSEPAFVADDPALQPLADRCGDGDMEACDELYFTSEFDSAEEEYGDTCGGLQDVGTGRLCVDAFPD